MSLIYYRVFNLASLSIGVSLGYFSTYYLVYRPKKLEESE
jgi:hypothetical protein